MALIAVRIVLLSLLGKLPPNKLFPSMQSRYEEALENRVYDFQDSKSYYDFIINNKDNLKEIFRNLNAEESLEIKGKESIKFKKWKIPKRQV